MDAIRVVLSIAAQNQWHIYQMDVKFVFLNGILEEEIYVDQKLGYIVKGHEHKVFMLKKALCDLKHAPRAWYSRIDSYLINNGFNRSNNEPTLYVKIDQQGKMSIVCLYVDDMIYVGDLVLEEFMSEFMKKEFEIDLGLMKYFLGLEVTQTDQGIFICQYKYPIDIL